MTAENKEIGLFPMRLKERFWDIFEMSLLRFFLLTYALKDFINCICHLSMSTGPKSEFIKKLTYELPYFTNFICHFTDFMCHLSTFSSLKSDFQADFDRRFAVF